MRVRNNIEHCKFASSSLHEENCTIKIIQTDLKKFSIRRILHGIGIIDTQLGKVRTRHLHKNNLLRNSERVYRKYTESVIGILVEFSLKYRLSYVQCEEFVLEEGMKVVKV